MKGWYEAASYLTVQMETCSQDWVLGVSIVKSNEKIEIVMVSGMVGQETASALGFTQGVYDLLTPVMGEGHIPRVRKSWCGRALRVVAPLSFISDFSEDTWMCIYLDPAHGRPDPKI